MKIIMLGPQGSGKGTQAKKLSDELHIKHISTGEILRKMPKDKGRGKIVHELISKGNFVPDDLIAAIVSAKLSSAEFKKGFILDGFPRNLAQAKMLQIYPDHVIYLDLPDRIAISRLSARRQCRSCEAVYGPEAPPKKAGVCDNCGGELYQRDDDKPAAIKKRLQTFHRETEPLRGYYSEKGLLDIIDGNQPIDDIFRSILEVVKGVK